MTLTQYRRWRSFSCRLARHGFPKWTEHRRGRLERVINHFLDVVEHEIADIEDWDSGPSYICDRVTNFIDGSWGDTCYTRYTEDGEQLNRFADAVMACIRAGLDVASAPSAGVLGFTIGHLRKMWAPRPIPAYVRAFFTEPLDGYGDEEGVWL